MMKKKGFTLAEVLITLTIIGVVAVLTLPSLMTNTQDQQAVAGLKKIVNTLNEIGAISEAQENFGYGDAASLDSTGVTSETTLSTDPTADDYMSIAQIFRRHAKLKSENDAGCLATFLDGTCVVSADVTDRVATFTVDVNGAKAPNRAMEIDDNGTVTQHGDRFNLTTTVGNSNVEPSDENTIRAYQRQ